LDDQEKQFAVGLEKIREATEAIDKMQVGLKQEEE